MHAEPRPSRTRYVVLMFLCSLSFVLYLDRICMGQAVSPIQDELRLNDTQMGEIAAAFTIAYGLFEVPTGRWGDRYGSRGVLVRIVLWWSAFTALTGATMNYVQLVLVRFLFGAGEAGALPNSARVVRRWFPANERGPAQGWLTMSSLVGAVATPVVAQELINRAGWRWTFVVFGAVGVVWAIAFYRWFRDDPACHPRVNQKELDLITAGRWGERAAVTHRPIPWRAVWRSANVWLLGFTISCSAFASYLYYSWYPKYLEAGRALTADEGKWLTALVLAGGAIGCVIGGYLGREIVRRTGETRWSRRILGSGGLAVAAAGLAASVNLETALAAALVTGLASLTACISLTSWWAVVTEISGSHLGTLFGLMNSMGVLGAAASQLFFGRMSDYMKGLGFEGRERYDPAFYVYSGVLLAGAVGWMFIDATRPVESEEQGEH